MFHPLPSDLERIRAGIGDKCGMLIRSFSQFLSGLIIGFIKGWKLSLVMLSVSPLLAISFGFMIKVSVTRSAGHFIWLHDQSKCDPICWPFHLAS